MLSGLIMYVYVLRTDQVVLGVFAESTEAIASKENFAMIHSKMFPQREVPKVHLDLHVVIGGTTQGDSK